MRSVCKFARARYVDYKGWVQLLDLEHVECTVYGEPKVVEAGKCEFCGVVLGEDTSKEETDGDIEEGKWVRFV